MAGQVFPFAQRLSLTDTAWAPSFARGRICAPERWPRIDGYDIERQVGEGRTSVAYLARDQRGGGKLVLKVLRAEHAANKLRQISFLQEFAVPDAIRNPHVIRVHERVAGQQHSHIAMEYLGGGDLARLTGCGLEADDALSLLRQAACALAHLHRQGYVHCDVKPANLLLRYSGDLVLADFGLARRLDDSCTKTRPGLIVGTPAYASPEQAEGALGGTAADVYSLGIVFYEMLCGKTPFPGRTPIEVLCQHLMAPVPRLPQHVAQCEPLLDAMLAKKAGNRLADGQALLERIDLLRGADRLNPPSGVMNR